MAEECEENFEIDAKQNRYPYCIVWTPIPVITWLIPLIGHMGIATSRGIIRDFAGPYFVAEGNMAFGNPTKPAWAIIFISRIHLLFSPCAPISATFGCRFLLLKK